MMLMFNKNRPPGHKRNTLKLLYYYECGLFEWLWVILSPLSNGNEMYWLRLCVSSRECSEISTLLCTLGLSAILWENSSTQLNSTLNYVLIMQAVKRPTHLVIIFQRCQTSDHRLWCQPLFSF